MLQGMDESKAKANYFIGNDQKNGKPTLTLTISLSLGEVYKGIELEIKGLWEKC